jgi:hypothetical protein
VWVATATWDLAGFLRIPKESDHRSLSILFPRKIGTNSEHGVLLESMQIAMPHSFAVTCLGKPCGWSMAASSSWSDCFSRGKLPTLRLDFAFLTNFLHDEMCRGPHLPWQPALVASCTRRPLPLLCRSCNKLRIRSPVKMSDANSPANQEDPESRIDKLRRGMSRLQKQASIVTDDDIQRLDCLVFFFSCQVHGSCVLISVIAF